MCDFDYRRLVKWKKHLSPLLLLQGEWFSHKTLAFPLKNAEWSQNCMHEMYKTGLENAFLNLFTITTNICEPF